MEVSSSVNNRIGNHQTLLSLLKKNSEHVSKRVNFSYISEVKSEIFKEHPQTLSWLPLKYLLSIVNKRILIWILGSQNCSVFINYWQVSCFWMYSKLYNSVSKLHKTYFIQCLYKLSVSVESIIHNCNSFLFETALKIDKFYRRWEYLLTL